jgi:hypothetical protein
VTDVAPHLCHLLGQISSTSRVTVIPVTDDGQLIAISHPVPDRLPRCSLPTGRKVHPRVNTTVAAHHLLVGELGCRYTDLRLVAVLEPADGHPESEAVYTAHVYWPTDRPAHANGRTCALTPIPDFNTARRLRLQPVRVVALLTGPHLAQAVRRLPELRCEAGDPHTGSISTAPVRANPTETSPGILGPERTHR